MLPPDLWMSRQRQVDPLQFPGFHSVPPSTTVHRGIIKWFSLRRRFGFIFDAQSGEEIFFHQSNTIVETVEQLTPRAPVYYMVRITSRGPEAYNISPASDYRDPLLRAQAGSSWPGPTGRGALEPFGRTEYPATFRPSIFQMPSRVRLERRSIRRFRCYNCGQYASHKAIFCPMQPMRRCCYRCRSSTHLLADCPFRHYAIPPTEVEPSSQMTQSDFGPRGSVLRRI
ncbi:unnamed protein product [Dicrocoelium dendriticum]|nr:unnamed protein product [Dicrocoelium dendriticum]